jgi:outer membrane protein insertion porin family
MGSCGTGFRAPAVLVLLLCAGRLAAQVGGEELEGKTVGVIEFRGLEKLTPDAVKALMETKEGGPFRRDVLDHDVKALAGYRPTRAEEAPSRPGVPTARPGPAREEKRDTPVPKVFRFIPSVRAEWNPETSRVDILVLAQENARVAGLVFLGAVQFDREDLLPLIRTRAGNLVDDFTLEFDRQEIRRFYRDKGYHYATVDFVKQAERLGDLIVFKIVEGEEVKIRRVHFTGNAAFTPAELMKEMPFTEEPGLFSSREFVLDQVRRDAVALTNFYRGRGYRDAEVVLVEWRPSPDHSEVELHFEVREGALYRVRSITIKGMTLFQEEEARADWQTLVGGPYAPGFELRRDMAALEARYHSFGYTEVRITDDSVFDETGTEVDVLLTVAEGDITYVGEILIRGNVETQDRIIRREIELYTGEPLDPQKLKEARQRIRALRYFTPERGVNVALHPMPVTEYGLYKDAYLSLRDTSRKDVKDIVVELEEQDTSSLRFAAGVASSSGFLGDITYEKTNFDPFDWPESLGGFFDAFTGGGQFLTASWQPGTRFTRYRLAWGNPRIFDSRWGVVADIYKTVWFREDWDEDRVGASFKIGRRFGSDFRADLTLRNELVDVEDIDGDAPQIVFDFEGERSLASLTLDLRLIRVDDYIDPKSGYVLKASIEHGGLWGDIEFNKVLVQGERYFDLYEDDAERHHVLQVKGSVGWAGEYGSSPDIPIYERFFLGGENSLRGFRYRGVGPQENDSPVGGKALWTSTVEYQFPLFADAIRGVLFVDAGSLGLDWSDSEIWDVRVSAGFGFRVVIPFLGERPVALDFGIPLIRSDQDETQLVSFSFGRYF